MRIPLLILLLAGSLTAFAQTSPPQTSTEKATGVKLVFEKIFVHTDREIYAAGDTIWYKVYLINPQNNKPINISGSVHVQLISPQADVIANQLVRMQNGSGYADVQLPDSIPGGKYTLRVYTNWMRNFGDNFIFEKKLTILQAPSPPGKTEQAKLTARQKSSGPVVHFFPEGGSLVQGITSFVAIKAENAAGKGFRATGWVVSASGDTLSRFITDTLGFGLVTLLPIKGQSYRGGITGSNNIFSLPTALASGPTLRVVQADSAVRAMINLAPGSVATPSAYTLVVKHAGHTIAAQSVTAPADQPSVINIPKSILPEGIASVTVYDDKQKPLCERLVYVHHGNPSVLDVNADQSHLNAVKKVSLTITAPAASDISLAVVDRDVVPPGVSDIETYMMLQSEVRGTIEHAERYFDANNPNRYKELDVLLLTQGWRDFLWRRLADTTIRISYAPEQGISIKGQVYNSRNNKPVTGSNVSLFAPGNSAGTKLFAAKTDSAGRFWFNDLVLNGKQNIRIASLDDKGDKTGTIGLDTLAAKAPAMAIEESPAEMVIADPNAMYKKLTGGISRNTTLKTVNVKGTRRVRLRDGVVHVSLGDPQNFTITDKDAKFKTLEWYMLQNVKGAQPKPVEDGAGVVFSVIRNYDATIPSIQGTNTVTRMKAQTKRPRLIVEGREFLQMDDDEDRITQDQYFSMPITNFKHITVQKVTDGEDGRSETYLIYLTLKEDALFTNPGSLQFNVNGFYEQRAFYSPQTAQEAERAGYKPTVYWNPSVKTDAQGHADISFYNTLKGKGKIILQGVSPNGQLLSKQLDL